MHICNLQGIGLGAGNVGLPLIFRLLQIAGVLTEIDFDLYCFSWIILFLEAWGNVHVLQQNLFLEPFFFFYYGYKNLLLCLLLSPLFFQIIFQ